MLEPHEYDISEEIETDKIRRELLNKYSFDNSMVGKESFTSVWNKKIKDYEENLNTASIRDLWEEENPNQILRVKLSNISTKQRSGVQRLQDYISACENFHKVGECLEYKKQFVAQFTLGLKPEATRLTFTEKYRKGNKNE